VSLSIAIYGQGQAIYTIENDIVNLPAVLQHHIHKATVNTGLKFFNQQYAIDSIHVNLAQIQQMMTDNSVTPDILIYCCDFDNNDSLKNVKSWAHQHRNSTAMKIVVTTKNPAPFSLSDINENTVEAMLTWQVNQPSSLTSFINTLILLQYCKPLYTYNRGVFKNTKHLELSKVQNVKQLAALYHLKLISRQPLSQDDVAKIDALAAEDPLEPIALTDLFGRNLLHNAIRVGNGDIIQWIHDKLGSDTFYQLLASQDHNGMSCREFANEIGDNTTVDLINALATSSANLSLLAVNNNIMAQQASPAVPALHEDINDIRAIRDELNSLVTVIRELEQDIVRSEPSNVLPHNHSSTSHQSSSNNAQAPTSPQPLKWYQTMFKGLFSLSNRQQKPKKKNRDDMSYVDRLEAINFDGDIPDRFQDLMTCDIMKNPWVASDGRTYDKSVIDTLDNSPFDRSSPFTPVVKNVDRNAEINEFIEKLEKKHDTKPSLKSS